MGKRLSSVLAIAILLSGGDKAAAQGGNKARELIQRAVDAQGGVERLSLELAGHRKSKGAFITEGFRYVGDSYSDKGDKRRLILNDESRDPKDAGPPNRLLVMVDKKTGWISYDGSTYDLDAKFLQRIERSAYADHVCGLVTLLKDEGYTLSLPGEQKVKDRPAARVLVAKEGKPDVTLWFDKESGLLVKSANKTTEQTDPVKEKEILQEVYYGDYQAINTIAPEERLLSQAKVAADGPSLLEFIKKRIADEAEHVQMKDLILKLGHKSFSVRQKASTDVIAHGIKAAPLLREAAKDSDRETARRAEQALARVSQPAELELTAAVLRLVAVRKPAKAAESLLAYYAWAPDEKVRHEVLGALAEVATEKGKQNPVLAAALKDRDPQRRAAAAAALGQDGGKYLNSGWRRVYVEGLRVPMTTTLYRDGAHFMDIQTTQILFYNRLDDSLFKQPSHEP